MLQKMRRRGQGRNKMRKITVKINAIAPLYRHLCLNYGAKREGRISPVGAPPFSATDDQQMNTQKGRPL
jgi:hypothetical protein